MTRGAETDAATGTTFSMGRGVVAAPPHVVLAALEDPSQKQSVVVLYFSPRLPPSAKSVTSSTWAAGQKRE